jgi:hypothetical protein
MVSAAGPGLSILAGVSAIGLGMSVRIRPAVNLSLVSFGLVQIGLMAIAYPAVSILGRGQIRGDDFALIFSPRTPELLPIAVVANLAVAAGLILLPRIGWLRRRYDLVTGAPPERISGSA